ncbi:MAG: hypothetical protein LBT92_02600 [Rickettsiales bacterium]|nr:hypothetical protein [Rickettsiales bacterium]
MTFTLDRQAASATPSVRRGNIDRYRPGAAIRGGRAAKTSAASSEASGQGQGYDMPYHTAPDAGFSVLLSDEFDKSADYGALRAKYDALAEKMRAARAACRAIDGKLLDFAELHIRISLISSIVGTTGRRRRS